MAEKWTAEDEALFLRLTSQAAEEARRYYSRRTPEREEPSPRFQSPGDNYGAQASAYAGAPGETSVHGANMEPPHAEEPSIPPKAAPSSPDQRDDTFGFHSQKKHGGEVAVPLSQTQRESPALILLRMMRKTLPARPLVPRHKNGKTRCGEPHSSKDKRVWSKTSLGHQISPMGGKRNRRVCQGSGSPLILQKETGSRGGEKPQMAPVPLGHILRRRADSKDIFPQRTVPIVEKMPPLSKVGKGRGCWGPSAKCFIRWIRKRC